MRTDNDGIIGDEELRLQMLEQLLLVNLIIGRWILPKGDISREQLSQILLAYLVSHLFGKRNQTIGLAKTNRY